MRDRGDGDRISADVSECQGGVRADRCEPCVCGEDAWNVGDADLLGSGSTKCGAWNRVGHDPDICKSSWRVRGDVHAGGQYSGEDGNYLPEDSHGDPGRRLRDGGNLGRGRDPDRTCCDHPDESDLRETDEDGKTMVEREAGWD